MRREAQLAASAQRWDITGFGLVLIRAIADELIYNERQNEVVFVKYLDEPGGAPSAGRGGPT
jgi:hypothetical protein